MGSLTLPQVAATLAAALVGFQAVNHAGDQLIDQAMLNTALVLVVVTSMLGPIMTQWFLRRIPASSVRLGGDGPITKFVDAGGELTVAAR
jgi:Na+:H+ antiporter